MSLDRNILSASWISAYCPAWSFCRALSPIFHVFSFPPSVLLRSYQILHYCPHQLLPSNSPGYQALDERTPQWPRSGCRYSSSTSTDRENRSRATRRGEEKYAANISCGHCKELVRRRKRVNSAHLLRCWEDVIITANPRPISTFVRLFFELPYASKGINQHSRLAPDTEKFVVFIIQLRNHDI